MSPDDEKRLLRLADRAHEAWVHVSDTNPAWWHELGNVLDRVAPIDFWRNTGDAREKPTP